VGMTAHAGSSSAAPATAAEVAVARVHVMAGGEAARRAAAARCEARGAQPAWSAWNHTRPWRCKGHTPAECGLVACMAGGSPVLTSGQLSAIVSTGSTTGFESCQLG
jgi:hypothetical protein